MFVRLFHCINNNNILTSNPKARKGVVLGGAQTHTSCNLGKHPNHLDHQHYWLLLVLALH